MFFKQASANLPGFLILTDPTNHDMAHPCNTRSIFEFDTSIFVYKASHSETINRCIEVFYHSKVFIEPNHITSISSLFIQDITKCAFRKPLPHIDSSSF